MGLGGVLVGVVCLHHLMRLFLIVIHSPEYNVAPGAIRDVDGTVLVRWEEEGTVTAAGMADAATTMGWCATLLLVALLLRLLIQVTGPHRRSAALLGTLCALGLAAPFAWGCRAFGPLSFLV